MKCPQVNLLAHLRSKTQVDLDTFDIDAARELGGCIDCTSNQYEYYTELAKSSRNELLDKSIKLAASIHGQFLSVTFNELAVEIAAVYLAMEIVPMVDGNMHIMANPRYSYSKQRIIETGKRLHHLCKVIQPSFNTSRLVMKVPATWEGLQACRELTQCNIKVLATTLFTMEQAVLAGEVGCVSISPFVHELKALFDEHYEDSNPRLDVCLQAQRWYTQQSLATKVKACATVGVDELLQLAGIDALTIVPDDLRELKSIYRSEIEVNELSLFKAVSLPEGKLAYPSYIDDEAKYRMDFDHAEDGKAQFKLCQAITIFCDYQNKAECLVQAAHAGNA
ncbi:hypothetical protein N7463_000303 [Penicillium fimorum]|uniref:Transaldolase n=1 Tax=Penicillium fimorum TaxID=1882269 RepID=A0A9X0CAZ3_9EURO|nr:hypothetical protein N7463_000303 [Penicillium fimorum]